MHISAGGFTLPRKRSKTPRKSFGSEVGEEHKLGKKARWGILFGLFLTSCSVGFAVGRASSPDYSDPSKAYDSIQEWTFVRVTLKDTKWRAVGDFTPGETTSLQLTDATIQFNCGSKTYQRNLVTGVSTDGLILAGYIPQCESRAGPSMSREDRIAENIARSDNNMFWEKRRPDLTLMPSTTTDLPPLDRQTAREAVKTPRKGLSFEDALLVAVGANGVASVRGSVETAHEYWILRRTSSIGSRVADGAKMAAAILSGYALGYYLGYENSPNCTSKDFESQLQEPKFWVDLGVRLKAFYLLQFRSAQDHTIYDAVSPRHATLNLRDVYLPLRAAKLIDCSSASLRFSNDLISRLDKTDDDNFAAATIRLFRPEQYDEEYFGERWWVKEEDGKWQPLPSKTWNVIWSLDQRSNR